MSKVYNFSAGPSVLPLPVLERVQKELLNYNGSGFSILEASHRDDDFMKIIADCQVKFKKHLGIGDNYKVLFLGGGASTAFFQIPMNLLSKDETADYIDTGMWSNKAYKEAGRYGNAKIVASSKEKNYNYIPQDVEKSFTPGAKYRYLCSNNTIFGTRWNSFPKSPDAPLIGDFSSDILSRKVDFSDFGIIFGGVQKNLAPAGATFVVIREDVLSQCNADLPSMCSYKLQADNDSMFNTPPVFSIYVMNYVLDWLEELGGVAAIEKTNLQKAKMLYDTFDGSSIYSPTVPNAADRSIMNVTFVLPNEDLTKKFLKEAGAAGFSNLKGHRSVGGCRASIYNAFPMEGVEKFVDFLKTFEKANK